MTTQSLARRLAKIQRRNLPGTMLPRPWFDITFPDGGPGTPYDWVETRTMEEAIAEGAPVFTVTFPNDPSDIQGHTHG